MAKIVLTRRANTDLARLRKFLADKSPIAADGAAQEIWRGIRQLSEFPRSAPEHKSSGLRELSVRFGQYGYVIRYGLDGDNVIVLRIFHTVGKR